MATDATGTVVWAASYLPFGGIREVLVDAGVVGQDIRHALFQSLCPEIYATQLNGNRRFDLMLAAHACWIMAPDELAWPRTEDGGVSFKLEDLAAANGYAEHDAHDALGDVRATIYLARLIRDRAPEVWRQMLVNTDKHRVRALVQTGDPVRLVARFGKAPPRSYIVAYAGTSTGNANEVGLFDIERFDPREFVDADDEALDAAVTASPKVIRSVTLNKQPIVFPWTPMEAEDADEIISRADALRGQGEFLARVGAALARR